MIGNKIVTWPRGDIFWAFYMSKNCAGKLLDVYKKDICDKI